MQKTYVVIAAAGYGRRAGSDSLPKQFLLVGDDVVIRKSVRLFLSIPEIDGVICVIPEGYLSIYEEIFQNIKDERLLPPVVGGDARQESVKSGLEAISKYKPDLVLIHDGARNCCDAEVVKRVLNSLHLGNNAVIPAISPVDSVRVCEHQVERRDIKLIQTPQGFDFQMIYDLHKKYESLSLNDDSSLCELEGIEITVVEGNIKNVKITYPEDMVKHAHKVGFGYDAHRFSKDRKLHLMGIKIENHIGLEGNSDADVGIHSLVDAILGALGLGSIGEHFPSIDPKWKDADSKIFLKYCKEELNKRNGMICNIDTTIVCESPNISQYSHEMKKAIALCLEIDESLINIKGKTTEGLGFTGRMEGIEAYTTVLITNLIRNA